MNPFLAFLVRTAIAIPASVLVWLISFFGFDQTFFISSVLAFLGGGLTYYSIKGIMKHRFLKRHGLTRKEYKYISKNLEEAQEKLKRMNKALFSIHYLPQLKQSIEVSRITKKIFRITKKEPKRFYLGEEFFFYHLDSLVELSEKYAFLSAQPTKNMELEHSLSETRWLLEELSKSIEKDLDQILSNDMEQLNFELDMAKHNMKKLNNSRFNDESRRLK